MSTAAMLAATHSRILTHGRGRDGLESRAAGITSWGNPFERVSRLIDESDRLGPARLARPEHPFTHGRLGS